MSLVHMMAVWLTAAMLFTQTIRPELRSECGCGNAAVACSAEGCCCCAGRELKESPSGCPHCRSAKTAAKVEKSCCHSAEEDRHQVCQCGDDSPGIPELPPVPDSHDCHELADSLGIDVVCVTAAPLCYPAPAQAQVPSSDQLIRNFRQVVFGVWLT